MTRLDVKFEFIGYELGEDLEKRVVLVFQRFRERWPSWLLDLNRPGKWTKQDRQKIDIVAMTTIGPVFIQLKSSESAVRAFQYEKRDPHLKIRALALDIRWADKKIYQKVVHEIDRGHDELYLSSR